MADEHERLLAARASEYFREGSVLVLIFGLLDPMVQRTPTAQGVLARLWERLSAADALWALFVIVLSLLAFLGGRKFDKMVEKAIAKPAANGHSPPVESPEEAN